MAHEDLTTRCGHEPTRVALEELHLQGVFDLPQLLGGRRLRHPDRLRRAHHAALLVQVCQ